MKNMNNSIENIGKAIKTYRLEKSLSQDDISKLSGIERSQLSRIEAGEVQGVTFATLEKILNVLGKTLVPSSIDGDILNVHPFVKWAGGKTQLLNVIDDYLPKEFNNYFEPFIGGGALLFHAKPINFTINDMNSELIAVYNCFTNETNFKELKKLLLEHERNHSEEYFYQIRDLDKCKDFADLPISVRAARMLYLNKSCFNGLYRVNSKGFFNVPSGKKKTVKCFDETNFTNIREFFKNSKAKILNVDFEEALKNAKEGDFVYFDPPYDTWEEKDSFTAYSKNEFGKDDQRRLANLYKKLSNKGVKCMLSNHNTAFIRELYKDFKIIIVPAKRMINANGKGRGNVEEVLVLNY